MHQRPLLEFHYVKRIAKSKLLVKDVLPVAKDPLARMKRQHSSKLMLLKQI